jgi:hypothetical protein
VKTTLIRKALAEIQDPVKAKQHWSDYPEKNHLFTIRYPPAKCDAIRTV